MAEMFGRYRLDALIGRGGMGEVYRAYDTERHRVVALKCLPAGLAADAEFRSRFTTEASLAATLHEPHIIPIHDYGDIDGRLFIDMRLVDGRDLAAVLDETGPMHPQRAVAIVAQVAAALDAAHRAGMVHRDIKPGNVLLTAPAGGAPTGDFVYLADFGVARAIDDPSPPLTMAGAAVGSVDYMAPERFTGDRGDHRVDVYALGCLLFELLTARKPFEGKGAPALLYAHLSLPAPRPSDIATGVPHGLDDVVARALPKDPDARFQAAGALAAAAMAALAPAVPEPATLSSGVGPAVPGPSIPLPPEYGPQTPPASQTPGQAQPPWPLAPTSPGLTAPVPRRRRLALVVGLAVALSAVGGGAVAVTLIAGSDSDQTLLEPVRTPGANPFMPPAGVDRADVIPPAGSGGSFTGATPGLYGGTRKMSSCDPDQMVTFLTTHAQQAAAWAGVEGISPADIPTYIAGLTPVVLRSDTAVTNHGFRDGKAPSLHSVLQAGTAVLIDAYGVPRAKCYCGNPLTAPSSTASSGYSGTRWSGFSAGSITRIQPASAPLTAFTLVDPTTHEVFTRPVGGRGPTDATAPSTAVSPSALASSDVPSSPGPATSSSAAADAFTQAAPPTTGAPTSARPTSSTVARTTTRAAPASPTTDPTTSAPDSTTEAAPTTTTSTTSTTSQATTPSTTPLVVSHPPVITDTSSYWEGTVFHAKIFYNDPDGDASSYTYSGGNQLGQGSGSVAGGSSGVIDQAFRTPGCAAGAVTKAQSVSFTVYDRRRNSSRAVIVSVVCPSDPGPVKVVS